MQIFFQILVTSLLSYMLQKFLPPLVVMPCAALAVIFTQNKHSSAFLGGFVAVSILWMYKAMVIDIHTKSVLSLKVAAVLGFRDPVWLILLTGLVGGLLGGFGAMSGQHIILLFRKKTESVYK